MAATTFGYNVMVRPSAWPLSPSVELHELGHVHQWQTGQLTYRSYAGQLISALFTAPNLTTESIHETIPLEVQATDYAQAIVKAYQDAGEPCKK